MLFDVPKTRLPGIQFLADVAVRSRTLSFFAMNMFNKLDDKREAFGIGLIGQNGDGTSPRALELLKARTDDHATKAIGNVACSITGMANVALEILKDRDTDASTEEIANIAHKENDYARAALSILKDRKSDEATLKIGSIAKTVGAVAYEGMNILRHRSEDTSSRMLEYLAIKNRQLAPEILEILSDREGNGPTASIGRIARELPLMAPEALFILQQRETPRALLYMMEIGKQVESLKMPVLQLFLRKGYYRHAFDMTAGSIKSPEKTLHTVYAVMDFAKASDLENAAEINERYAVPVIETILRGEEGPGGRKGELAMLLQRAVFVMNDNKPVPVPDQSVAAVSSQQHNNI